MSDRTVLLVDVQPPHNEHIAAECKRRGLHCRELRGGEPQLLGVGPSVALCVIEVRRADRSGRQRLRSLAIAGDRAPVAVLARDIDVDGAVEMMRAGAVDVLRLPASRAVLIARLLRSLSDAPARDRLVGSSPAMQALRGELARAARVDSTVLLQGETGTGKGLIARRIHERSTRARAPFVHVDCAALSPTLIESELFGHERGAFTGAGATRRGRFELAGGGTIFLDEIGDLDERLQAKLLRVLEDRRYERVGGSVTLEMRARVLAATSHALLEAARAGRFRRDLYYRLNVLRFDIPPLRRRLEDLPELVESGLTRICARLGVARPAVSAQLLERLARHDWPGNVRELLNVLERIAVLEPLEVDCLEGLLDKEADHTAAMSADALEAIDDEVERMRAAIIGSGGNLARASRRLGIPRGTLRYRIERHGLGKLIPRD